MDLPTPALRPWLGLSVLLHAVLLGLALRMAWSLPADLPRDAVATTAALIWEGSPESPEQPAPVPEPELMAQPLEAVDAVDDEADVHLGHRPRHQRRQRHHGSEADVTRPDAAERRPDPSTTQAPLAQTEPASSAPSAAGAQTSGGNPEADVDLLRRYVASLSRLIRSKLAYPASLRNSGYDGVVWVRFTVTESGAIQDGSLVVARSSGHPELDEATLIQVAAMAPFPAPLKPHAVTVPVVFRSEG